MSGVSTLCMPKKSTFRVATEVIDGAQLNHALISRWKGLDLLTYHWPTICYAKPNEKSSLGNVSRASSLVVKHWIGKNWIDHQIAEIRCKWETICKSIRAMHESSCGAAKEFQISQGLRILLCEWKTHKAHSDDRHLLCSFFCIVKIMMMRGSAKWGGAHHEIFAMDECSHVCSAKHSTKWCKNKQLLPVLKQHWENNLNIGNAIPTFTRVFFLHGNELFHSLLNTTHTTYTTYATTYNHMH